MQVVWWNGHEGIVCILAWWKLCGFCGNACELLVAIVESGVLEAQDGVVGVVWPSFWNIK